MKMRRIILIVAGVMFTLFLTACGRGTPPAPTAADTQPFQTAIAAYLEANSMGMAVTSFDQLQVDGVSAKAVCKMKAIEGDYNMAVTWEFEFEKTADGWKVKGQYKVR
jgi:hypothetical protein